jgi:hypothetical protein
MPSGPVPFACIHSRKQASRCANAQVRYEERGLREEEWLCLARCRFSWQTELPSGSHPNPTFVPGVSPSNQEAVDHKVCYSPPSLLKTCL